MAKRSKHRLKFLKLGVVLAVLVIFLGFVIDRRLERPLPTLTPQSLSVAAVTGQTNTLTWPNTGQAAIGINGYGIVVSNGAQTPAPTASIAKLITALAVLKVKPLAPGQQGPTLTMTQNDVNYYRQYEAEDGSVALVADGEQISEYQMLEGMLLPSANNMADSLAVWAFGSMTAYQTYANHMLVELGLTHTHVGSDASGFLPDTTSTATDLVHLGEIVSSNPVLAGIVSLRQASLPVAGAVTNVDWLLGTAGINGIKTGNSNQAGGVYLFSAPYQTGITHPITIVGALMQAPTLQAAMDNAVPLLTSVQKAFLVSQSLVNGQAIGQYTVPWGGTVTAVTKHSVSSLTWQGKGLMQPSITLSNITIPEPAGTVVGTVTYPADQSPSTSSSPVVLSRAINRPSIWWRIFHT